jgi:hypothetical protein
MSVCNPSHPNCLKQFPSLEVKFCAGCGRSAGDIAREVSAGAPSTASSDDISDMPIVSALDIVSDTAVDEVAATVGPAVESDALDDIVFADVVQDVEDDAATSGSPDSAADAQVGLPSSDDAGATSPFGIPMVAPSSAATASPLLGSSPQKPSPSVSLQDALSELQAWSSKWNCQTDPYVAGLSQAISQRDDLTMWASLSPKEHLPQPQFDAKFKISDVVTRLLTLVRNVMVFVPVAITWYAIGMASEAYGEFTQDNPNTNLNFLQFWQRGEFGGEEYLSSFWHIGEVARFDAILIGIIVVLTLVVGALSARRDQAASRFEQEVGTERLSLGLTLANALHGRKSASPESIGESLAEALNDLTQAARDVNDVAARLERATVGVDTLGPKLDVLNQHTDRLVGQSVQSITTSMSALVASVGQLNSAVSSNVTQVFADATANLEEVSAQFSRIAASMEVGAAQLREDLEAINRQFGSGGRGSR